MKQIGSNDCGLFCIAYAEDLAEGNDPPDIKFDQNCMWRYLVECVKNSGFMPKKFKESQQQKKYISRNYSCCQPVILLNGSYFLVKTEVMRRKEDL